MGHRRRRLFSLTGAYGNNGVGSSPLRFASMDGFYPDSNPAVSPVSNAGADSLAFVTVYKLEQDYNSLTFAFYNDQFGTGSGAGPGNSNTLQDASLVYNGVAVPLYFSGSRTVVMADNARDVKPDTEVTAASLGLAKFSKGTYVKVKGRLFGASLNNKFARSNQGTDVYTDGSGAMGQYALYNRSTASVSTTDADGKYTFVTGSAASSGSAGTYIPVLLGRAVSRKRIASLALGDSIPTRFLGTDVMHQQFGNGVLPMFRVCVPGCDVKSFNDFPNNWKWLLQYCDDVYIHLGDNDIASSKSTWEANNSYDFWNAAGGLKDRYTTLYGHCTGKRIHQSHLLMPSTSTDVWSTVNGQTPVPHWEPVFAQSEPWMDARVADGTLYAAHSVAFVRNTNAGGKNVWNADGVTAKYDTWDGIHLSNNGDNGTPTINTSGVGRYNKNVYMLNMRAASVAIYGVDVPNDPTLTTITPGNAQANITWLVPEYNGGAAYTFTVQYKASVSGTWLNAVTGLSAATVSYDVTGLTNNTQYDFRVLAVNSAGSSNTLTGTATPTAISYDANLSGVFNVTEVTSITKTAGVVSNWKDARGSNINMAQATTINQPTQSADGAKIAFGNNQWLTSDVAQKPDWFDIVVDLTTAVTAASAGRVPIYFAGGSPVSLTFGSATGASAEELITVGYGTGRTFVTATSMLADKGVNTVTTGKHVISIRYDGTNKPEIWYDGTNMTTTQNGTTVAATSAQLVTVGATNTGASDFLDGILEVRNYSAAPVTSTSVIQAELKTNWGIA